MEPHLAATQQAGDAGLHDIRCVPVRRAAEMCEQRAAAEPALGLDVLLHPLRDDAAARRNVSAAIASRTLVSSSSTRFFSSCRRSLRAALSDSRRGSYFFTMARDR